MLHGKTQRKTPYNALHNIVVNQVLDPCYIKAHSQTHKSLYRDLTQPPSLKLQLLVILSQFQNLSKLQMELLTESANLGDTKLHICRCCTWYSSGLLINTLKPFLSPIGEFEVKWCWLPSSRYVWCHYFHFIKTAGYQPLLPLSLEFKKESKNLCDALVTKKFTTNTPTSSW